MQGASHSASRTIDRVLVLLALACILDRTLLWVFFGSRFTGGDDTVLWLVAEDLAHGIFREPFFYGQNYGFPAEAWLAAPLLLSGLAHAWALPLVTNVLCLFPFLIAAWSLHRQGSGLGAAWVLLCFLAMPSEYALLTGMSRGFVAGIAVAAPLFLLVNGSPSARKFAWFGFIGATAYVINPNAVPLIALVGIHLVSRTPFRPTWYALTCLGAIPLLVLDRSAKEFYVQRPHYLAHWMQDVEFDLHAIPEAVMEPSSYFAHLVPFMGEQGAVWMVLLPIIAVLAWRYDRAWSVALVLTGMLLILFLGVNKVRDGAETLFHSRERMFLALPLILAWGMALPLRKVTVVPRYGPLMMAALGLLVLLVRSVGLGEVIDRHTEHVEQGPVVIVPTKDLCTTCARLAASSAGLDADVLVFAAQDGVHPGIQSTRAYACSVEEPGLPPTLVPVGDRRTWSYMAWKDSVPATVLIHGMANSGSDYHLERPLNVVRSDNGLLLVHNDSLTLKELLALFGVPMKRHPYE
jgi:hypothetical protein